METLSKKKIKNIMEKNEIITVGEFIERYYGETMSPFGMELYYTLYLRDSKYLTIHDEKYPIRVERKR